MNINAKKIYISILEGISRGRLKPGGLVPKEIELAKNFHTTRMNAHRAVNFLAEHKIVVRKKRIGTTVSHELDFDIIRKMLKENNQSIYVIYSMTPRWIHWNEASFAGLEETLAEKGFSVSYGNIPTGSDRKQYKSLLDEISEAGATALVIFPDSGDLEFLCDNADLLLDFQMPIFMLNRSGEPIPLDMVSFVATDPFGDGVKVGSLLQKNKIKDVIILRHTEKDTFWDNKRCEGVKMGLNKNRATKKVVPREFSGNLAGIKKAATEISKNKNMTVVATNNEYAARFVNYCNTKGLAICKDYKLIAFDDNPLYRSYNFTSLGMPMKEIGHVFGEMICENSWIKKHCGKVSVKVNSKLIVRESLLLTKTD